MKFKQILLVLLVGSSLTVSAQQVMRPVLTGAPFLRVSPDARAGGLGDQGVATSADAFSQYWNAAKYNFSTVSSGIGVSYTPFLSNLTNDVFLLNGTYFTQVGKENRSTLGVSLYYFNLGEINLTQLVGNEIQNIGTAKPNEFSIDLSYGLRLSESYSMAVTGRFIRSDLFNNIGNNNFAQVKPANSFAVDVAGYLQTQEHDSFGGLTGRFRTGFQISNIGPKLDYSDDVENASFLPTNLRLGAGYDLFIDDENSVSLTAEAAKLLVPTPQQDGIIPNDGVISGIFNSFGDAPDGFSEELKEITYSISAEYKYNNNFALRAGYFHESPMKGARQYLTLGAGLKYKSFGIDFSYLITTSPINSALDNTLRFALTWDIGGSTDFSR